MTCSGGYILLVLWHNLYIRRWPGPCLGFYQGSTLIHLGTYKIYIGKQTYQTPIRNNNKNKWNNVKFRRTQDMTCWYFSVNVWHVLNVIWTYVAWFGICLEKHRIVVDCFCKTLHYGWTSFGCFWNQWMFREMLKRVEKHWTYYNTWEHTQNQNIPGTYFWISFWKPKRFRKSQGSKWLYVMML